jgi:hypothetical protein
MNVLKKFRIGFPRMNIGEKKFHYRLVHLQEKMNNDNSIKHEFTAIINQYYKLNIKNVGSNVATLALGSRPRQRLAKVWAKGEFESHISCSQECKRV